MSLRSLILVAALVSVSSVQGVEWTERERATLRSLWRGSLGTLPADPSNRVADDPRAAEFGHRLFFDGRLSANGKVSCAHCHRPDAYFTDGLPRARALGESPRNTPTLVAAAFSPWFYWDGRKDSQWSQALAPLETPAEHGTTRLAVAHAIADHDDHRRRYEEIFGALPDLERLPADAAPQPGPHRRAWLNLTEAERGAINQVFANVGKSLAAYQRRLLPGETRFDRYVAALIASRNSEAILTDRELAGLRLFIADDQSGCTRCHNGPLFTNHDFHNIGLAGPGDRPLDLGRQAGVAQVRHDPFNCLGAYSDASPAACAELRFMKSEGIALPGAFKVPSLRGVADTAPYMHRGQIATLEAVLAHYVTAKFNGLGHQELEPRALTADQIVAVVAFLKSLSAPVDADPEWLAPP